ncbi:MAG: [Fe-Fe] hydrogenase large subunit C-terminal domain-containing protein [Patescibacteria group bacterium]|nr:[Fe-Fe] hydrogenase large subunit C-terminal domain-containing protein [Patescibacteria group bacterium]MDD5120974.1 [Fe-Fe] hydrogenase large subunit C-terminal domain-containing protein [Patescibacteria group bacterium]MDD5222146.1 [Fe-Fe] hydrogenase large subunit C-terminal domain-containing protein [Patescibacteria group bacterium]MDD5396417.1 [Fe-Fe] hydrogenase large subunit C-terminal domain-containing protein [Patescibacteria group bacterium]
MQETINLIKNNKSVAFLAPTFAIDFKYPAIIGMLRKIGFDEVTELTYGARMVNWAYVDYIKAHSEQKLFISTPCPTVVAFIRAKYPEMVKFLIPIVSPMVAMAKIYKAYHPDYRVVFISPCFAKRDIEAPKYKDLIDAVIPLRDLKNIFDFTGTKESDFNRDYYFDSFIREYTKIYPVSGGLASTSHIKQLFKDEEILITDGVVNIQKAFEEIKTGQRNYRFLDLLNCPGGCIGGPAINNKDLSTEQKREIIKEYVTKSSQRDMGSHKGKVVDAKNVDLTTVY